ncbi:MAG: hypothetical protein RTV41_12055 [Candidatus Thorarchaeota archaeon]
MAFTFKQLRAFEVEIKYARDEEEPGKGIHRTIAESLENSAVNEIKGLELESLSYRWVLDNVEETVDEIPFISISKGEIAIRISRNGFTLRIPKLPARIEGSKPITKPILREASEILNKILLSHAGITKKTEIETTATGVFVVESKVKDMNEVLSVKCIDTIRKKGFQPSLDSMSFSFRDELRDRVNYSIRTRFPMADPSKQLKENQVEWRCSSIEVGPLEGLDLISKIEGIITTCKQVSSALGV